MRLDILAAAGGIALVDIVLSGDNALVIGAAASKLPRAQRYLAVFWGGLGAVVLRIALAVAATEMLRVPLLQAAGGVILLAIAIRLLLPESENGIAQARPNRFFSAMLTIIIADATMSLDNVLAVGALANGNIPILVGGLAVSITLLFVASAIVARLMEKLPWLLELASLVLAWTAANLLMADPRIGPQIGHGRTPQVVVHAGFLALIALADLFIRVARRRRERRAGRAKHIASVEESLADSARMVVANLDSGDNPDDGGGRGHSDERLTTPGDS